MCSWNILASAVKILMGFLGVVGVVSGFGLLGVGWFGLWAGLGFGLLGLVLVVFARPLCTNRTNFESILVNCFWL